MAGTKQRNPGVRCTGSSETGTLLLHAGTECIKDRDNHAGACLTIQDPPPISPLKRDEIRLNRYRALALCLSMIFSENRYTLFRIML
jgi:hypothetical protein